jgi:hypothetical protein
MSNYNIVKLREIDAILTVEWQQASDQQIVGDWFYALPWPAWVKAVPSGDLIANNPAYRKHYGIDAQEWGDSVRAEFSRNDSWVVENARHGTFVENVINPATGNAEALVCIKFPIFRADELVAVGGFAVYLPV